MQPVQECYVLYDTSIHQAKCDSSLISDVSWWVMQKCKSMTQSADKKDEIDAAASSVAVAVYEVLRQMQGADEDEIDVSGC